MIKKMNYINFMNRKIKAVMFDMDGLLLDTEAISAATFQSACRVLGFDPDMRIYSRCIGTTDAGTREVLTAGYGPDFPYDAVSDIWRKLYREETMCKPVPLKNGALELLRHLDEKGVRKVVVTSTQQAIASRELGNSGLISYFESVIGGDQVSRGKPDPEIYLTACRALKEDPAACLVLEDSDNGVLSAAAAGLTVVQVPDQLEPAEKVKALGHPVLRSLTEFLNMLNGVH